jgi:hypothetical protein
MTRRKRGQAPERAFYTPKARYWALFLLYIRRYTCTELQHVCRKN